MLKKNRKSSGPLDNQRPVICLFFLEKGPPTARGRGGFNFAGPGLGEISQGNLALSRTSGPGAAPAATYNTDF
ncbi:MAG: hypothetical protein KJ077_02475 [Anaerolineae bacterium]|nr:hypothetical protein [Anaerolineae bacterium]